MTTQTTQTTDIDDGILNKIESLLRMANDKRGNENEASNAMRAAQRLADAHNLSLASLDPANKKAADKRREDKKFGGGLYQWQRDLYKAIAELNHCRHWVSEETVEGKVSAYEKRKYGAEEAKYRAEHGMADWGREWRHRLLGSPVNVLSTQLMAEYLQGTVERLARDFVNNDPKKFFIQDAIAFREGAASRIVILLQDKRREDIAEQQRQREEAAARNPGGQNQLVILDDIVSAEAEANYDYLNGEGAWARVQADKARREAAYEERLKAAAEAERIQDEWDAAHPEEAAARKRKEAEDAAAYWADWEKRNKRSASRTPAAPRTRSQTDAERRASSSAYYSGSVAGSKVSLDKQVDSNTKGYIK